MKNLLVPVDFSLSSLNALTYAFHLANALEYQVHALHVFNGNVDTIHPLTLKHQPMEDALNDKMKEIVRQANANAGVLAPVVTTISPALLVGREIMKYVKAPETEMVVVGRHGDGNAIQRLMGSIASTVAQQADCPVMIVPEKAKWKNFDHILYASNYESADDEAMKTAVDFGRVFKAAMHFVHVGTPEAFEAIESDFFDKLFEQGDPEYAFSLLNVQDGDVLHGLNTYAAANKIDLQILVNFQRDFWNTFLQNSMTQKMALSTHIPLLVLHIGVYSPPGHTAVD